MNINIPETDERIALLHLAAIFPETLVKMEGGVWVRARAPKGWWAGEEGQFTEEVDSRFIYALERRGFVMLMGKNGKHVSATPRTQYQRRHGVAIAQGTRALLHYSLCPGGPQEITFRCLHAKVVPSDPLDPAKLDPKWIESLTIWLDFKEEHPNKDTHPSEMGWPCLGTVRSMESVRWVRIPCPLLVYDLHVFAPVNTAPKSLRPAAFHDWFYDPETSELVQIKKEPPF